MTLSDIDLVEKIYNSKEKGYWGGKIYKGVIFEDVYLSRKYKNILHSLRNVHIFIDFSYKTKNIDFELYDATKRRIENRIVKINLEKHKKKLQEYIQLYKDTTKRFTYFSFSVSIKEKNYGHANAYLYDSDIHTIERYDSCVVPYQKYLNPRI
ncbi:MAG TPA: hypothetical protein V6C58_02380, partial [Allocoleopsis sp.]